MQKQIKIQNSNGNKNIANKWTRQSKSILTRVGSVLLLLDMCPQSRIV